MRLTDYFMRELSEKRRGIMGIGIKRNRELSNLIIMRQKASKVKMNDFIIQLLINHLA